MTASLLERYEAGEFEAVWREIRALGDLDDEQRSDVMAVALATMRRVAQNADLVAERLRQRGWRPLSNEDLRVRPHASDQATIEAVENLSGEPVPPSLAAFWQVVGGIDFAWDYTRGPCPDLGVGLAMNEMDPLCVDPPVAVEHVLDHWQELAEDPDWDEPLRIDLAPDDLHKANISGGDPYAILVPFRGGDPRFDGEAHDLPFVDYLRLSFKWAGFPGLEAHGERDDVRRFVADFGKDLVPF